MNIGFVCGNPLFHYTGQWLEIGESRGPMFVVLRVFVIQEGGQPVSSLDWPRQGDCERWGPHHRSKLYNVYMHVHVHVIWIFVQFEYLEIFTRSDFISDTTVHSKSVKECILSVQVKADALQHVNLFVFLHPDKKMDRIMWTWRICGSPWSNY